jgi:hypothetical protein
MRSRQFSKLHILVIFAQTFAQISPEIFAPDFTGEAHYGLSLPIVGWKGLASSIVYPSVPAAPRLWQLQRSLPWFMACSKFLIRTLLLWNSFQVRLWLHCLKWNEQFAAEHENPLDAAGEVNIQPLSTQVVRYYRQSLGVHRHTSLLKSCQ